MEEQTSMKHSTEVKEYIQLHHALFTRYYLNTRLAVSDKKSIIQTFSQSTWVDGGVLWVLRKFIEWVNAQTVHQSDNENEWNSTDEIDSILDNPVAFV